MSGETSRGEVEDLYRSDSPRLWRSLFAYVQSRSVADDAVAEAFAQLLRRGNAVRDPESMDLAVGVPDRGR